MLKKHFYLIIFFLSAVVFTQGYFYFKFLKLTLREKISSQEPDASSKIKEDIRKFSPVETTKTYLRVLGILLGNTKEEHLAVIKDIKTGRQGFYHIRDTIGLLKVKQIHFDRVILERPDSGEELILTVEGIEAGLEEANKGIAECSSPTECFVEREGLKKRLVHINEVLKEGKVLPAIEKGKLKGFKVQDLEKGGLAQELGLKKGDIVRAVNEEPLDGFDKPFVIYSKYKNSPVVQVDIERQGRNISLIYRMR